MNDSRIVHYLVSFFQSSRLLYPLKFFKKLFLKSQFYQKINSFQQLAINQLHQIRLSWRQSFSRFFFANSSKALSLLKFKLNNAGLSHWRKIFEGIIIFIVLFIPVLNNWGILLPFLVLLFFAKPEKFTPIIPEMVIFGLILFFSALVSVGFQVGFQNLNHYSLWLFIAVLVSKTFNSQLTLKLIRFFLCTSIIWIGIGFFQQFSGVATPPGWLSSGQGMYILVRSFSLFTNPNIYALFLLVILILTLFMIEYEKHIFWSILCSLILIALFFTYSRIAWIIGGVILLNWFWRNFQVRGLLLFLSILGFLFLSRQFTVRLDSLFSFSDPSFYYRLRIWQGVGKAIANNWVWGTGPGSFPNVYPWYQIGNTPSFHTHQFYLQLWLENGIFSLLAFLLLIIRLVKSFPHHQKLVQTFMVVIIIFLVYGFTETWTQSQIMGGYFWLFCGLLISVMDEEKMA